MRQHSEIYLCQADREDVLSLIRASTADGRLNAALGHLPQFIEISAMKTLYISGVLALIVLLAACTTAPQPRYSGTTSYPSAATSGQQYSGSGVTCTNIVAHDKFNGEHVPSYYRCDGITSTSPEYSSGACSWVNSYTRRDGTIVSGHNRCSSNVSTTPSYSAPSVAPRSSSSSNCHYVSGYTTKKGRRVSGYMRCR